MSLLSVAEAQARILALAPVLDEEIVPLAEAVGRWTTQPVAALRTQPAAELSAMDGYAIRFVERPGPWRVVGESAGGGLDVPLAPGEAARIFTGAPLPRGSDTILVQEDATREGEAVTMTGEGPSRPGLHVRPRGADFAAEERLIDIAARLSPARIALAAAAGHGAVAVRRRVRVALLSTGDELVAPGAPVTGAQLPASNAVMIAAMLRALPVDVVDHGIVRDRLDDLVAALAAAGDADVIVTIGGASVGDHDLVGPALREAGAQVDFWKVAVKPGKPVMAGRLGPCVVVGLPGNPVSAFVTTILFVMPLLRAAMGDASPLPVIARAGLVAPLPAVGPRAEYLRGVRRAGGVAALERQDNAALTLLAQSELLVVRGPDDPPAAAGDIVEYIDIA